MGNGGSFLLLIALLPFLGALVPGVMIRAGRTAFASFQPPFFRPRFALVWLAGSFSRPR